MNDFEKQLNSIAGDVRLTVIELASGKERLLKYMQESPARPSITHSYFAYFSVREIRLSFASASWRGAAALCVLVLVFTSATVSYAAEGALPGDTLYPVKVSVNEEVKAALSLSSESKATWDVRRAERRLEEAEQLAVSGEITPNVEAELETHFKEHVAKAVEKIAKLQDEQPEAASALDSQFDATLQAHNAILETIDSKQKDGKRADKVAKLRGAVALQVSADVALQASVGTTASATTSTQDDRVAKRLKQEALTANGSARASLEKVRSKLDKAQAFQIDEELRDAKAQIEAGDAAGKVKDAGVSSALSQYKKSYAKSRKLSVFLNSNVALSLPGLIGTSSVVIDGADGKGDNDGFNKKGSDDGKTVSPDPTEIHATTTIKVRVEEATQNKGSSTSTTSWPKSLRGIDVRLDSITR